LNFADILAALLPVPLKYYLVGHGKTTAAREQQIDNPEGLKNIFHRIFYSLKWVFKT